MVTVRNSAKILFLGCVNSPHITQSRESSNTELSNLLYIFVPHRNGPSWRWPRPAATSCWRWATAEAAGSMPLLSGWRWALGVCSSPPNCRRCSCSKRESLEEKCIVALRRLQFLRSRDSTSLGNSYQRIVKKNASSIFGESVNEWRNSGLLLLFFEESSHH